MPLFPSGYGNQGARCSVGKRQCPAVLRVRSRYAYSTDYHLPGIDGFAQRAKKNSGGTKSCSRLFPFSPVKPPILLRAAGTGKCEAYKFLEPCHLRWAAVRESSTFDAVLPEHAIPGQRPSCGCPCHLPHLRRINPEFRHGRSPGSPPSPYGPERSSLSGCHLRR